MKHHLLTIPGELRNRIYEFALTEPPGLVYGQNVRGVGHLCLQKGQQSDYEMFGQIDTEKRNIGLKRSDCTVANQLQFVNRQLYNETKGLGLRYNSITIRSHRNFDKGVLRRFLDFLKEIPAAQHKNLTTVILKDRGAMEWAPNLESACKFCRCNPHVLVKLHQNKARPNGVAFVFYGAFIKHVYRRDSSSYAKVTDDTVLQQELRNDDRRALAIVPVLPPNLRIFPAKDSFDEAAFHEACSYDTVEGWMISTIEGGIDTWIPFIKDWYENGF